MQYHWRKIIWSDESKFELKQLKKKDCGGKEMKHKKIIHYSYC